MDVLVSMSEMVNCLYTVVSRMEKPGVIQEVRQGTLHPFGSQELSGTGFC